MKNKWILTFVILILIPCTALNSLPSIGSVLEGVFTPNTEQMSSALREALKKGAENAGTKLSVVGAFNNNPARKIPLPPDAQPIITNISKIPGGQKQVDDLILRINAAAERASNKVAPIFAEAITSMTISDAANILKGSNTAATEYLEKTTTDPLKNAFRPELNKALSEPIVGGISAQQAWGTLVTNYNSVANSAVGKLSNMKPVNSDINEFVLDKALVAIFSEMANEEKNIRANPMQFLSDVSAKVFNWAKK
ncbi:DUF4197 domain-containing protein [Treponema sp. R6D11]